MYWNYRRQSPAIGHPSSKVIDPAVHIPPHQRCVCVCAATTTNNRRLFSLSLSLFLEMDQKKGKQPKRKQPKLFIKRREFKEKYKKLLMEGRERKRADRPTNQRVYIYLIWKCVCVCVYIQQQQQEKRIINLWSNATKRVGGGERAVCVWTLPTAAFFRVFTPVCVCVCLSVCAYLRVRLCLRRREYIHTSKVGGRRKRVINQIARW